MLIDMIIVIMAVCFAFVVTIPLHAVLTEKMNRSQDARDAGLCDGVFNSMVAFVVTYTVAIIAIAFLFFLLKYYA